MPQTQDMLNNLMKETILEKEAEASEETEKTKAIEDKEVADADDDEIFAALQAACVKAGYDASYEKRKELIAILGAVEAGDPFPDDIMSVIQEELPGVSESRITRVLRPQVPGVMESMRQAVVQDEELMRIRDEEERRKREEAIQRAKERLRCRCPANYDWHREGNGWRCNGGSHYVTDEEMNRLYSIEV